MALGEAFVNVRADLKPFAKDLEKGLKTILLAAEKRITADASVGRGLQAALTRRGEEGLSEGFQRGISKGTKTALTTGQKFFSALADFADDGLSAIPAKVKAGILIGIIGATAVAAPFLAGVISAAITSGLAIGFAGLGIALAAQSQVVRDGYKELFQRVFDDLRGRAVVFVEPLLRSANIVDAAYARSAQNIRRIFQATSQFVEPLATALTSFVERILPGIAYAVTRAGPLVDALATGIPQLGTALSIAFATIADGGPEAALALRDLFYGLSLVIINVGITVRGLTELYFWLRITATAMTGDFAAAAQIYTQRAQDASRMTPQFTEAVTDLDGALGGANAELVATRLAITSVLSEMLKGVNGTIQFEQAIDDLAESFRKGNRELDVREEKGRQNLRLIEAAILGAAEARDAEIARAAETGRSVDEINAAYQRQIDQLVRVTGKVGEQDKAFQDLIARVRQVPADVEVEVKTPGLSAALQGMRDLANAALRAARAGAEAIRRSTGGAGLQTVPQYAAGDIITKPTLGLIAEAGYSEAVIPDPAVMPQRALELSNKFGLTSLISEAMRPVMPDIAVYIGTERLDARIDYHIAYSNATQAQSLSYGPRS